MKRLTNLIVFAIAVVYFLLDAIFATVALPLSRWIAAHWAFARIHRWILSLSPYPTLALFMVPLIALEPVKPVAAYLVGTGRAVLGLSALAIAEILKLVCIERLFSVCRAKLLSIPAFAWGYRKYSAAKNYLTSLEAWQLVLRWSRLARNAAQRLVQDVRRSTARGNGRWLPSRERAQGQRIETIRIYRPVSPAKYRNVLARNFHSSLGTEGYDEVFARRARGPRRHVNMLGKILSTAAISAAVVAASAFSASAAIVCQGNVCWHTHEAYDFPHEAGVVVHDDNWHWGPHEKFRFREHEGRGYWRGGRWVAW